MAQMAQTSGSAAAQNMQSSGAINYKAMSAPGLKEETGAEMRTSRTSNLNALG